MARHGRRRIIKHDKREIRLIVDTVHCTRNRRREERRIADERKTLRIPRRDADALCDAKPRTHTETCVDHIEWLRVAQRVAADVTRKNAFFALHRLLDRVE